MTHDPSLTALGLSTIDSRLPTVLITGDYQEYYDKVYGRE